MCFEITLLLHLIVTTERPVQVNVVKVKKSDKGDFYKRQTAWALRDLAVVDAKDAVKVGVTFLFSPLLTISSSFQVRLNFLDTGRFKN